MKRQSDEAGHMKSSKPGITVRLLYVSHAAGPQTTTMTTSILLQAQINNADQGITGLLCQGQGFFLQVLEGERTRVNALYRRICADKRHHDVDLLLFEEIADRLYGQWAMALIRLSADKQRGKIQDPDFDPYSVSGPQVLQQMLDLLASGQEIPITAD
jgi:hypothetical protein